MAQGDNIVPIPGTTKVKNLDSNINSLTVSFSDKELQVINKLLIEHKVLGDRYTQEGMKGING
jgi:aryl-alcohol dehydrogenase-like predicted oxidoreductase